MVSCKYFVFLPQSRHRLHFTDRRSMSFIYIIKDNIYNIFITPCTIKHNITTSGGAACIRAHQQSMVRILTRISEGPFKIQWCSQNLKKAHSPFTNNSYGYSPLQSILRQELLPSRLGETSYWRQLVFAATPPAC